MYSILCKAANNLIRSNSNY